MKHPCAHPTARARHLDRGYCPWDFDKFNGKLVLVGVTTAVLLFVLLMATFNMPPFDLDKLEQLKPGMTKEEVTLVLGTPTHEMNDQWTYAGWGWPMVHIYFDVNERFESSEYDY